MVAFFTADTHFSHRNIVERFERKRPFADIEAHDEALIANWNAVVGPDDECWHLGDFAYRCHPRRMAEIFARLNGRKHLVRGNHDTGATESLGWTSVHDIAQVAVPTKKLGMVQVICCHYAMRVWPRSHHGSYHLYGHSHGGLLGCRQSHDVGVDVWGWRPVRMDEVLVEMEKLPPACPETWARIEARREKAKTYA